MKFLRIFVVFAIAAQAFALCGSIRPKSHFMMRNGGLFLQSMAYNHYKNNPKNKEYTIRLRNTSESQKLPYTALQHSHLLKTIIEEDPTATIIELDNAHFEGTSLREISAMLTTLASKPSVKFQTLYPLINSNNIIALCKAANYLDIEPIFKATTTLLCQKLEGIYNLNEHTLFINALKTLPTDIQKFLVQTIIEKEGAFHNLEKVIDNESMPVKAICWSPDGTLLACGSEDGLIKIWNVGTNQLVKTIITKPTYALSWSPNGNFLASGAHDGTVTVWETHTGNAFSEVILHSEKVTALAWSHDSTELGCGFYDGKRAAWNLHNNIVRKPTDYHVHPVVTLQWNEDASVLFSESMNGRRAWNLLNNADFRNQYRGIVTSKDIRRYMQINPSSTVLPIYNNRTGKIISSCNNYTQGVQQAIFNPINSSKIASISNNDSLIKVWNIDEFTNPIYLHKHSLSIEQLIVIRKIEKQYKQAEQLELSVEEQDGINTMPNELRIFLNGIVHSLQKISLPCSILTSLHKDLVPDDHHKIYCFASCLAAGSLCIFGFSELLEWKQAQIKACNNAFDGDMLTRPAEAVDLFIKCINRRFWHNWIR